jgi:hypothetical protein
MSSLDNLTPVLDGVHLLLAEIRELRSAGVQCRIVHRFHHAGSDCLAGEEIAAAFVLHRGREYRLRLSLALRIVFDFLARHSRLPQSARQIELGLRADAFCKRHAANVTGKPITRRIPRSALREYMRRLRQAFRLAFEEAGLRIDPASVLVAEETVGNEIGYRLKAKCEWVHVDLRPSVTNFVASRRVQ